MERLWRQYDTAAESWRILIVVSVLFVILLAGLTISLTVSERLGWGITVVPLVALIGFRLLQFKRSVNR